MEFQVVLTYQAERDLGLVGRYIARNDEHTSQKFCHDLLVEAKSLRTFPERHGSFVRRPNVRKLPYKNYIIFYKIYEDTRIVEILRFWHAARNQKRLHLKEETPGYKASFAELELRRHQIASGEGAVIPGDEILLRQQAQSQQ